MLRRVRYDGVMRCSRAFDHGGAALVVTSHLGPGVVHGDRLALCGTVDDDAHLIVTAQAATRILGGARRASADARWAVGSRARLQLIGEPLVASAGGRYDATVRITLARGARVLLTDAVNAPADSEVRLRTIVESAGRELLYDAVDAQRVAPAAFGTFVLLGLDAAGVACATGLLDELCPGLDDARAGVGVYPEGVLVRILSASLWPVYAALARLRDALGDVLMTNSARRDGTPVVHLSNDVAFSSRYDVLKS